MNIMDIFQNGISKTERPIVMVESPYAGGPMENLLHEDYAERACRNA